MQMAAAAAPAPHPPTWQALHAVAQVHQAQQRVGAVVDPQAPARPGQEDVAEGPRSPAHKTGREQCARGIVPGRPPCGWRCKGAAGAVVGSGSSPELVRPGLEVGERVLHDFRRPRLAVHVVNVRAGHHERQDWRGLKGRGGVRAGLLVTGAPSQWHRKPQPHGRCCALTDGAGEDGDGDEDVHAQHEEAGQDLRGRTGVWGRACPRCGAPAPRLAGSAQKEGVGGATETGEVSQS